MFICVYLSIIFTLKKLFNIFCCFTLCCIMLFGSIGIPLNSMRCSVSGKTVVSVLSMEECCNPVETGEESCISSICCDFSSSLLKLDVSTSNSKGSEPAFNSSILLQESFIITILQQPHSTWQASFAASPPPLLSGREILNLYQAYRI
jgi:hypothetical protein